MSTQPIKTGLCQPRNATAGALQPQKPITSFACDKTTTLFRSLPSASPSPLLPFRAVYLQSQTVKMKMEGRKRGRSAVDGLMEAEGEKQRELDLSGMSLDSLPNPASVNLALITKLDLSNNNLQSIPESLTARLLNLVVLDVHSNQLRTLPNSIGCLSKLRALNVSGNLLEGLPKTIEDCRALQELAANFNRLTSLPETMGFELRDLRKLAVNSNKLSFLPSSTSHMTSLRVLDARLNCLRCLPDGLENLLCLEVLTVAHNYHHLTAVPYSLGLLRSLRELDVSYNALTHLPASLTCLPALRSLRAEGNPLVSPSPRVLDQGLDAVRDYLAAKMHADDADAMKKKKQQQQKQGSSWIKKLVKCGTFPAASGNVRSGDGLMTAEYRWVDGDSSPGYAGIFSPRRLFSPRKIK
ncbi:hypothetical protein ZIOFF_030403 [Zingiber officinale]|uniref:Uncharacterized protein n=2 Tax=Zingiber officinale TaxID=94328 RepID=A0A8J5GVE8_ZINOF|nr:hypothetical protein ZIOFF_030403 [Zingiber officinale]